VKPTAQIERKVLAGGLALDADPAAIEGAHFTGYASTYGPPADLGGDIVVRGAFAGIRDGKGFPFLADHRTDAPIGLVRVSSDSHGLKAEGMLNLEVQAARERRALWKQGVSTGLSIGYEVLESYRENGIRYLTEVKLLEVSTVVFPMNPRAQLLTAKARQLEGLVDLVRGFRAELGLEEDGDAIADLGRTLDGVARYFRSSRQRIA
jgi:HK97 family phage prohead protease